MKKITDKFLKFLMLFSMIFSSLQTPIQVLASEISSEDNISKGAIRINGKVSEDGTVSSPESKNGITVTKIVSTKDAANGKYTVKFEVKGEETTETRPVYIVVVFDKSGSMGNSTKWNNAVKGAKAFAKQITESIPTSKLALVTFSTSAKTSRGFEHKDFEKQNNNFQNLFDEAKGGTNLQAGLVEAKNLLENNIQTEDKETALKYVVVMSDGEPTFYNKEQSYCPDGEYYPGYSNVCGYGGSTSRITLEKTLSAAKSIKDSGATIFSIGYSLKSDKVYTGDYTYNGETIKNAKLTTKDILTKVATEDTEGSIIHCIEAKEGETGGSIVDAFKEVASNILYPGFNATVSDTVGKNFRIVNEDNTFSQYGAVKTSKKIDKITKETITVLEFDIEIDQDAETGWHKTNDGFVLEYYDSNDKLQTITPKNDPEVYWIQNTYEYKVNYYKDSLDGELLKSDTRRAPKGTKIDQSNAEVNKYLSLAGEGYSFNNITPESITIANDGSIEEINVIYRAKGQVTATYTVDTENGPKLTADKISTGLGGDKYKTTEEVFYGYTLKEVIGNREGTYLPNKNIIVNYIYTKNEGTVTKDELAKTQIREILGANSEFEYILKYNGKIENYTGTVTVTLVDTLPYEVASITADNCSYNANNRELTCKKEVTLGNNQGEIIQDIEATFKVIVKYKDLISTKDLDVTNNVKSTLKYGSNTSEKTADTTDTIKSSRVIAKYVDESNKEISDSISQTGLIDNEYTTSAKEIYGYTLKEVKGAEKGKYTAEEITVTYIYSKNTGDVTKNEVTKTGPEKVTSVDGVFNYTLSYTGKIEKYLGKATLTLVDTIPYEIDEQLSSYSNNGQCIYDKDSLTITCTKEFTINKEKQEINTSFDLSLVFKNINKENVTNQVKSTLTYGNEETTDEDETNTKVLKGTVKAIYVDTLDNVIAAEELSEGFGGTDYTTTTKSIYGYTLTKEPANKNGQYIAEKEILVKYIYEKLPGTIVTNDVVKTQVNTILGANSTFKYVLTYTGKIKDYVGKATLTLVDTLPYEVEEIKYDENICQYNKVSRTLTCSKEVEIDEKNQENILNTIVTFEVRYKNLTSKSALEVKNVVASTLVYLTNEVTDSSDVTDTIKSSRVIAKYVDESNKEISDSISQTGLIDNEYTTSAKEIYGYTLKEVKGAEKGKYTAEEITVTYIYSKNTGDVTKNEVTKTGPEKVTSVDGVFNYTLSYTGKIEKYLGKATLTLVDTIPYEIDEQLSSYSNNGQCIYDKDSLTITCTKEFTINKEKQEINTSFDLSLVFKNINKENVTNQVKSTLTYGNEETTDEDETNTKVLKGTVKAIYVDTLDNVIAAEELSEGFGGTDYTTTTKSIYGYTLTKEPANKNGQYIAEKEILVKYVYDKNIGTSEEELTKVGLEKVDSIDSAFEYTITYHTQIKDYVGEVKILIEDLLPYEIDEEKSNLGNVCKYTKGKLICEYNKVINTVEDGNIFIEENIVLYFKNVDSKLVINQVKSTLTYGEEEKTNEDSTATEVASGALLVKYVDEDGNELADSITETGLVGSEYKTSKKVIDGYYLKEVVGAEKGKYTAEETKVTYIYSLIPLPPQTGYEASNINYVGLLISLIAIILFTKKMSI